MTLYAQWEGDETTYYVVYWQQAKTDAVDAADADKKYVYVGSSEARTAKTGDPVEPTEEDISKGGTVGSEYGYYFVYNENNSDTSKEVSADGTTTLNIKYDRREITYNFDYGYVRIGTNERTYGRYTENGEQLYYQSGTDWSGNPQYREVGNNDNHGTVYTRTGNQWNRVYTLYEGKR
jgi:hypothetical protein